MDFYFNEKDPTHWRRKLAMQYYMGVVDEDTIKCANEEEKYFNLKTIGSTVMMVTDIEDIVLEEA